MNIPPLLRRRPLPVAIAFAALVLGVLLALQTRSPEGRSLEALQASLRSSMALPRDFRQVPAFTLTGVDGEPLTEAVFEGRWSLVFFGFTSCPDVCPMTLSVVKNVVERLEEEGEEPPQVVFVTVDPARDTAARMKDYIALLRRALRRCERRAERPERTHAYARHCRRRPGPTASAPRTTRSITRRRCYLSIPSGRLRAKLIAPHELEPIVADYLTLMAEFR